MFFHSHRNTPSPHGRLTPPTADMLQRLIEHNDRIPLSPYAIGSLPSSIVLLTTRLSSEALTRFHSRTAPNISVLDYLRRIVQYTKVEVCLLQISFKSSLMLPCTSRLSPALIEVVPSDHSSLHRSDLRAQPPVYNNLTHLPPFRHRIHFNCLQDLLRFILPEQRICQSRWNRYRGAQRPRTRVFKHD